MRYETDANTGGKGVVIDNIAITGDDVDGGEDDASPAAWSFVGFPRLKDGIAFTEHFNAYVAENRQYDNYDSSLASAYNFGFVGDPLFKTMSRTTDSRTDCSFRTGTPRNEQ